MVIAIIFFGVCTALGIYIHHGYRLRKTFYDGMILFCDHMTSEIGFSKNDVVSVIDTYIESYPLSFRKTLAEYRKAIISKSDIEIRSFPPKFSEGEKSQVDLFFKELGRHSSAEEIEKIKNRRSQFSQNLESARLKLNKDASINLKLCIILGIAGFIMLI